MDKRASLRIIRRVAMVVSLGFGVSTTGASVARADEAAVVASAAMAPYAEVLAARLHTRMPNPPPIQTAVRTRAAIDRFCAPDGGTVYGLMLHRRLNRRELAQCREAGINPTEIALGVEAAVLAVPRDSRISRLSVDALFSAVIRDLPDQNRFRANAAHSWHAVDSALPDDVIAVLMPAGPHAARLVVDERGLQGACRKLPAMQAIYSAADRTQRCTALRTDDSVHEYDDTAALAAALAAAGPGTVAVVPYGTYRRLSSRLLGVPVDGVPANDFAISTESYPLSRRVYLYVRQPEPLRLGASDSLRLAMLADDASHEEMVGPGGAFAEAGLVPLPLEERGRQRVAALQRHMGVRP